MNFQNNIVILLLYWECIIIRLKSIDVLNSYIDVNNDKLISKDLAKLNKDNKDIENGEITYCIK